MVVELRQRLGEQRLTEAEHRGRTASTSLLIDLIVAELQALALMNEAPADPIGARAHQAPAGAPGARRGLR